MTQDAAVALVVFIAWLLALLVSATGWMREARLASMWEAQAKAWRRLALEYQETLHKVVFHEARKQPKDPEVLT